MYKEKEDLQTARCAAQRPNPPGGALPLELSVQWKNGSELVAPPGFLHALDPPIRAVAASYPDAFKIGKQKSVEYHLREDFNLVPPHRTCCSMHTLREPLFCVLTPQCSGLAGGDAQDWTPGGAWTGGS